MIIDLSLNLMREILCFKFKYLNYYKKLIN